MTDTATPATPGTITCHLFRQGREVTEHVDLAQVPSLLKEQDTLIWVDLVAPTFEDMKAVQTAFHLHPLAVEDAVQAHQRPKIEGYGRYWFIVVDGVTIEDQAFTFHEIAIFACQKFVITVRDEPAYPWDEVHNRWQSHPEGLKTGGGFLLYTILDSIVDDYSPANQILEDQVDRLEEALFSKTYQNQLQKLLPDIFQLKSQGQRFRHVVLPMRDVLNPLVRDDLDLFPEQDALYFRDVYDHATRIIDELDTMRELVNSALEIHVSVVANRQNEIVTQLTIIAAFFLPLTFIVGFFGMNFNFLVSHITSTPVFFVLGVGAEIVAVVATFIYFKVKGWF